MTSQAFSLRTLPGRQVLQNRERTGIPARAARVGWWMRPDLRRNLSGRSARYRSRFCNARASAPSLIMATTTETSSVLQSALTSLIDSAECRRVINEIKRGARLISISGLVAGPAKALVLAVLQRETGKQFAVVTQAQR